MGISQHYTPPAATGVRRIVQVPWAAGEEKEKGVVPETDGYNLNYAHTRWQPWRTQQTRERTEVNSTALGTLRCLRLCLRWHGMPGRARASRSVCRPVPSSIFRFSPCMLAPLEMDRNAILTEAGYERKVVMQRGAKPSHHI